MLSSPEGVNLDMKDAQDKVGIKNMMTETMKQCLEQLNNLHLAMALLHTMQIIEKKTILNVKTDNNNQGYISRNR